MTIWNASAPNSIRQILRSRIVVLRALFAHRFLMLLRDASVASFLRFRSWRRSFSCDVDALLLLSTQRQTRRDSHAGRFSVALVGHSLTSGGFSWHVEISAVFRFVWYFCTSVFSSIRSAPKVCMLSCHLSAVRAHVTRDSQLLVGTQTFVAPPCLRCGGILESVCVLNS